MLLTSVRLSLLLASVTALQEEVHWEQAEEVLAAAAASDPYSLVKPLALKPGRTYVAKQPIYVAANDSGIWTSVVGQRATIRASPAFNANCDAAKIEDTEKAVLMIGTVRDEALCLNNITIADLEIDGLKGTELGPSGNLRQASVGIYARSDPSADTKGPAANHSGACGLGLTMRNVHVHDQNVQNVGVCDWTDVQLLNSQLHGVANSDYGGFREPNCTTLECDSLGCGGDNWRWYCQYMHNLYYTRTTNAVIRNTTFDDAMWGSALDLTGALDTVVDGCNFSNIRQSVVYFDSGGYARDAKNLTMTRIVATNVSSLATVGGPGLVMQSVRARGVRFGFFLHGQQPDVSDLDIVLGGDTPSAADTELPPTLFLRNDSLGCGQSLGASMVKFV
jgi:hypothetical protein